MVLLSSTVLLDCVKGEVEEKACLSVDLILSPTDWVPLASHTLKKQQQKQEMWEFFEHKHKLKYWYRKFGAGCGDDVDGEKFS